MTEGTSTLAFGAKLKEHRYEIHKVLGKGSLGITYEARDETLQVSAAVKEYYPYGLAYRDGTGSVHPVSDGRSFQRGLDSFLDEARILAKLEHPSMARVYDFFKANGTAYMVMEFEPGESLDVYLVRHPRLHEHQIRELIFPLLEGLVLVHQADIAHRDIKPSNIIVRPDGTPCLLDFGVGRKVFPNRRLTVVYTPNYLAPEQLDEHGRQGPWTDVYALGAVCYRIIDGKRPRSALERLTALKSGGSDPLETAVELGKGHYRPSFLESIDRALRLDPAERPQDAMQWLEKVAPGVMAGGHIGARWHHYSGFWDKLQRMFRPTEPQRAQPTSGLGNLLHQTPNSEQGPGRKEAKSGLLASRSQSPPESHDQERRGQSDSQQAQSDQSTLLDSSGTASSEAIAPPEVGEGTILVDREEAFRQRDAPPDVAVVASSAKVEETGATDGSEEPQSQWGLEPVYDAQEQRPIPLNPDEASRQPDAAANVAAPESASRAAELGMTDGSEESASQGEIEPGPGTREQAPTLFDQPRQSDSVSHDELFGPRSAQVGAMRGGGWAHLFEDSARRPAAADSDFANPFRSRVASTDGEDGSAERAGRSPFFTEPATSQVAAHNDRALRLFRSHDYAGALTELEAARELEPDNPTLTANIHRVRERLERHDESKDNPWTES
jgi:serine/threonine protein kinase